MSAMQVLTEDFPGGMNFKIEGQILNDNAQTRSWGGGAADREKGSSSFSKKGRGVQRPNKVIDLCLFDRTGAVTITPWSSDAEVAELLLKEPSRTNKSRKRPIVAIGNVRCVALSTNNRYGTILTRMNVLTNRRTQSSSGHPCIAWIDKATDRTDA